MPPPLDGDEFVPTLLSDYDLAGPVTCELRSSGLNDLYEVTTGYGGCFLKVYRAGWRTREEVLGEIGALHHLNRKGVLVALPIARRDGAFVWSIQWQDRERQVVLFARATGRSVDPPDEALYRRLGQTLAEIHNATDDIAGASLRYDLENLVGGPLRELGPYLDDRPADRDFVCALVAGLRHRIEGYPSGALDWGYCHGDFRTANVLMDVEADAMTTLDFELGGIGFRAYDIAYTYTNLNNMALKLLWSAPIIENDEQGWKAFLQGYAGCRPLRPVDREAISLFVGMRAVQIMGYLLQTARQSRDGETWPPAEAGGLPGGDLFERALLFLRAWNDKYLSC